MLRSSVILDASMILKDALEALKLCPADTKVVIRRREIDKVYYYVKKVSDIRMLPNYPLVDLASSLKEVFDLHEDQAVRSYQAKQFSRETLEQLNGVLLDGEEVVGILEGRPRMKKYSLARGTEVETVSGAEPSPTAYVEEPITVPSRQPPRPRFLKKGGPKGDRELKSASDVQTITPYPRLDAKEQVGPKEQFTLTIGLSAEQVPGVAGGRMHIKTEKKDFTMEVQVIAPEFKAPQGIRHPLHVKRSRFQEAEVKVELIAPDVDHFLFTALEVEYFYEGNLVGRAWREIRVVRGSLIPTAGEVKKGATSIDFLSLESAPDLTVTIHRDPTDSVLVWIFSSGLDVPLPNHAVQKKLVQNNAQTFAYQTIAKIGELDGTRLTDEKMRGIAKDIAELMPNEFWETLEAVWKIVKKERPVGDVPSLLLNSSEPWVPWELASTDADFVDSSLVDSSRPPFLGAQLWVGRWILPEYPGSRGSQHHKLQPDTSIDIKKMAVVVGEYDPYSGEKALPEAKEEGTELSKRYQAAWVNATEYEVERLLHNQVVERGETLLPQVVHFACHGEVSGIKLSDAKLRIDANIIRGTEMTRKNEPFIFMNACKVGLASVALADYGGLAQAFLKEGCRGFIAPLWSVNDETARDIAVKFYELTLDNKKDVSEAMRVVRSDFDVKAEKPKSTYLAYMFFGHPKLKLNKDF